MCDSNEPKPKPKPHHVVDLTKPVQTRRGEPARIICTDRRDPTYPVVALVKKSDGAEKTQTYHIDGFFYDNGGMSDADLVNVPPKVVDCVYQNVYLGVGLGNKNFSSQAQAIDGCTAIPLGHVKLTTYEDGTFTIEKCEA